MYIFLVTKNECENLLKILDYENSKKTHKKLDRSGFRDILHKTFRMTDDMLMDRGYNFSIFCYIVIRQFSI